VLLHDSGLHLPRVRAPCPPWGADPNVPGRMRPARSPRRPLAQHNPCPLPNRTKHHITMARRGMTGIRPGRFSGVLLKKTTPGMMAVESRIGWPNRPAGPGGPGQRDGYGPAGKPRAGRWAESGQHCPDTAAAADRWQRRSWRRALAPASGAAPGGGRGSGVLRGRFHVRRLRAARDGHRQPGQTVGDGTGPQQTLQDPPIRPLLPITTTARRRRSRRPHPAAPGNPTGFFRSAAQAHRGGPDDKRSTRGRPRPTAKEGPRRPGRDTRTCEGRGWPASEVEEPDLRPVTDGSPARRAMLQRRRGHGTRWRTAHFISRRFSPGSWLRGGLPGHRFLPGLPGLCTLKDISLLGVALGLASDTAGR